jgi:hypothetical protein
MHHDPLVEVIVVVVELAKKEGGSSRVANKE